MKWILCALAAVGCGGPSGDDTHTGDDDGGSDDGGTASCAGTHFAPAATPVALPTTHPGMVFNDLAHAYCLDSSMHYALADLTGDGLDDLVVTNDCASSTVGKDHWELFENLGGTFAATPKSFALPTAYPQMVYNDLGHAYCLDSSMHYTIADLDGDRRPDLVVTNDCAPSTTVGKDHWLVFKNSGSGFAATGASFALPTAYPQMVYNDTFHAYCLDSSMHYALTDMDGDRRPDLVVTNDCAPSTTVGKDHWLLFKSSGTGFAATGASFALPTAYPQMVYNDTFHAYCLDSSMHYTLTDMDGDRRPDLVVTNDCAPSTTVGKDHWLMFKSSGSGFAATGASFALPTAYPQMVYNDTFHAYCLDSSMHYALTDLDGDIKPDLVVTNDCAAASTVGRDHWALFANTGTGFAPTAASFALPPAYPQMVYNDLGHAYCLDSSMHYAVSDLDGDKLPDLVVTNDCVSGTTVGKDHWKLFSGQCD